MAVNQLYCKHSPEKCLNQLPNQISNAKSIYQTHKIPPDSCFGTQRKLSTPMNKCFCVLLTKSLAKFGQFTRVFDPSFATPTSARHFARCYVIGFWSSWQRQSLLRLLPRFHCLYGRFNAFLTVFARVLAHRNHH